MKTIIQTLGSCLIALAITVGLAVIICAGESAMDASVWNDGICRCGGEFEFSNATHRKNGGNFYYYICNDCGKVIETNHQQTKSHKAYEVAGIVDEYSAESGCSVLIDWDGDAWLWEGEMEVGQLVIIVFDNMGTADIYDDKIIEIKG